MHRVCAGAGADAGLGENARTSRYRGDISGKD